MKRYIILVALAFATQANALVLCQRYPSVLPRIREECRSYETQITSIDGFEPRERETTTTTIQVQVPPPADCRMIDAIAGQIYADACAYDEQCVFGLLAGGDFTAFRHCGQFALAGFKTVCCAR